MLRSVGYNTVPNLMSPPSPFKANPILHKKFCDGQTFHKGKLVNTCGKPRTSGKPPMLSHQAALPESPCKKRNCLADFEDLNEDYEDLVEQKKVVEKERDDAFYQVKLARGDAQKEKQEAEKLRLELASYKQKLHRINQLSSLNLRDDDLNSSGRGTISATDEHADTESESNYQVI